MWALLTVYGCQNIPNSTLKTWYYGTRELRYHRAFIGATVDRLSGECQYVFYSLPWASLQSGPGFCMTQDHEAAIRKFKKSVAN